MALFLSLAVICVFWGGFSAPAAKKLQDKNAAPRIPAACTGAFLLFFVILQINTGASKYIAAFSAAFCLCKNSHLPQNLELL